MEKLELEQPSLVVALGTASSQVASALLVQGKTVAYPIKLIIIPEMQILSKVEVKVKIVRQYLHVDKDMAVVEKTLLAMEN